jgi:hypothetical protein
MQNLKRFARYWDMIANSGRFKYSKDWLLGDDPYQNFSKLSDWLYLQSGQTHHIALPRLFNLLFNAMTDILKRDIDKTTELLLRDYADSGIKGQPRFMQQTENINSSTAKRRSESRQKRHQAGN